MNKIVIESVALDRTEELLTPQVSDEALETAAGTSPGMQGGASLWTTFEPAGCTCIG